MAVDFNAVSSLKVGDKITGSDGCTYRVELPSRNLGGETIELNVVCENDRMSMVIHCGRLPEGGVVFQTHKKRPFTGLDMSAVIQTAE